MAEASPFPLTLVRSLAGEEELSGSGVSKTGACITARQAFAIPFLNKIRLVTFQGDVLHVLGDSTEDERAVNSIFEESNGYLVRKLDDVVTVDANDNGSLVAVGHRSGAVKTYRLEEHHYKGETDSEEVPSESRSWHFHGGQIRFVRVHKQANLVAVGSVNGRVRIYNPDSTTMTHEFTACGKGDQLASLTFHFTRLLLAVGTLKGQVLVYDLCRNTAIGQSNEGHESAVTDIKFIDAKLDQTEPSVMVISVSRDKWIKVYNLDDSVSDLKSLSSLTSIPLGKEETAEEREMAIQTKNKKSRKVEGGSRGAAVINIITKHLGGEAPALNPRVKMRTNEELEGLEIVLRNQLNKEDPNLKATWYVVTGGVSGMLRLWDLLNSKEVAGVSNSLSSGWRPLCVPIRRVFKTPEQVLAAGADGSIVFWDLDAPGLVPQRTLKGTNNAAAFHSVGSDASSVCIYGSGLSGTLQRITVSAKPNPEVVEIPEAPEECGYRTGKVSADGVLIAVASNENGIKIYATKDARLVATIPISVVGEVTRVAWNNKNKSTARHLAVLSRDMYVRVFRVNEKSKKGPQILSFPDHRAQVSEKLVYCMEVAPNDKALVLGGANKKVSVFSFPSLEPLGTFTGHKSPITAVAFSPIEQVVASASMDMTIKVWSLNSMETLQSLTGLDASLGVLLYHRNGIHLIGAQSDGSLKVWDTKQATLVGSSSRHVGSITDLVWVVPAAVLPPEEMLPYQTSMAAEETALCLVSCSDDGVVCVWRDETANIEKKAQETERERRTEVSNVALLINEGKYCDALRLSLKWRRVDLFESVVQTLKEAANVESSMVLPIPGAKPKVTPASDEEIEGIFEDFKQIDFEIVLMGAVHFSKNYRAAHFAQWLVQMIISQAHRFRDLRGLKGFYEFAKTFESRSQTAINRLEALREKSYLIDIILNNNS
eukprot:Blabericola_migrator_1__1090@NODE_1279_length_4907_cov_23_620455_g864_i0_p1_GENE_NODE_1279_length_4907_cov_23_620455_g864_i0NODE_1279_length_4907_cov_23_620455_g864_i0_p1_ORF_typecomplete_len938_score196_96ANAPC4_WD40/PF12894_7/1_1e08ANAPC4_WD40/PF12894_7/0_0095ANAPC4_WD40/PF12894_7/0_021ANAPC4_WD40/PF12894_7/7_9ANAPC4_WD40/PF12894_7/0_0005ANAPC4_WD40/PF12894_7/3_9e08ANAPC4_WD40/PF12894_7/1_8e06ANAPC4_WD40/PF12894_7/1_9e07ANAPC4_WD40/PF12894_7/17WD40/PF00400_32/4e02WD40/PF00400_32/4WD40/PF00400_